MFIPKQSFDSFFMLISKKLCLPLSLNIVIRENEIENETKEERAIKKYSVLSQKHIREDRDNVEEI